jgi:hypothetical protein
MKDLRYSPLKKIYDFIAKKAFFVGTLVFFVLHSAWIAVTAHILPYDEYYHIGIIRFYADKWSPFIASQPPEMSLYGDITRLPSYLYHFLMSFPYRVLDYFIENELVIMVLLRFINIAMIVAGLVLFRRLLIKARISARSTHLALVLFVAIPIVPVLSAQSNYDNLLFLITPIFLWYAYRLLREKPAIRNLLAFGATGMLATLIKHNFMAVFLAVAAYVAYTLLRAYGFSLLNELRKSMATSSKTAFFAMVLFFLVITGLFIERHGINALRYGQIKVDCAKVQPVEVCEQYSPWRRNQLAIREKFATENLFSNPVSYSMHWVTKIMRAYNAILANIAPLDISIPDPYGHYVFKSLLPLPVTMTYAVFVFGIVAALIKIKEIWQQPFLRLSIIAFVALAGALWIFNYTFYLKYGRAYAIQARYLLPLTIPVFAVFVFAWSTLLHNRLLIKQILTVGIVVLLIYSGGAVGWILRSEPDWYLPNDVALQANEAAKSVLEKVVWH